MPVAFVAGLRSVIVRSATLLVAAYAVGVLAMRLYVDSYRQADISGPVSAVVVLSAGPVAADGSDTTSVRTRVGIAAYREFGAGGDAPALVLSGGRGPGEQVAKSSAMAEIARQAGVPEDDIVVETRSDSTLQNALFSVRALQAAGRMGGTTVLVTDRFHLPRAWVSFHWAGVDDLALLAADETEREDWDNLLLECVKWPFNVGRAWLYSGLRAAGWREERLTPLLQ